MVSRGFGTLGKTASSISVFLYVGLGILLYRLLRPAGKILSLVAMLFNFAGGIVTLMASFRNGQAPVNPLLFFGTYCLLYGALIIRSAFLPHLLGVLNIIAGIGWFIYLLPLRAHFVTLSIEVFGFLAEAILMIWLLAKGVDEQAWNRQRSRY